MFFLLCRRDNVLRLWNYLLELLRARRMRLELSLQLQKIFQEMLYILDWMEEIKVKFTVFLTEKDKKSSITEKI